MKALYRKDSIIHGREGLQYGPNALEEILSRWLDAFPDITLTTLHSSKQDDLVTIHWRAEGTQEKAFRDIPNKESKVIFHGLTSFRCEDNQVIEHWACVDYRALSK